MSRTIRRKGIDVYYRLNYTKAHGIYSDYEWVEGKYGPYMSETGIKNKREIAKMDIYNHGDGTRYYSSGNAMNSEKRRIEEHRHRSGEKAKITRFLKGIDDDIVPSKLMKFPMQYW